MKSISCGLAVGVESLSANPLSIVDTLSNEIMEHPAARDCLQGMGWTSENVVEEFGIRREDMVGHHCCEFMSGG